MSCSGDVARPLVAEPEPSVTVVIPNYDGAALLGPCLTALAASRGVRPTVVVVDNGSGDDSVAVTATLMPSATVITNDHNTGFVTACNQGAEHARTPFVLFLNNDAIVEPDTLVELLRAASSQPMARAAIWQPPVVSADGLSWDSAGSMFTRLGFLTHRPGGLTVSAHPVASRPIFAAKGAAMLVRTAVFNDLGGFQEGFFAYFEETDLCWRAKLLGWEVWFIDCSPVSHIGGVTAQRILTNEQVDFLFFRNRLHSLLTALGGRRLLTVLPLHLLGALGLALTALALGRRDRTRGILRALVWPLQHPGEVWRRRRGLQAGRLVPDEIVFAAVEAQVNARTMLADGLGYVRNRPRHRPVD